uniref:Uncharacterized protein n=1 Tax=Rhizophora mucronata TaxID=61149 RepID=A0A2P2PFT0_RHIMU
MYDSLSLLCFLQFAG